MRALAVLSDSENFLSLPPTHVSTIFDMLSHSPTHSAIFLRNSGLLSFFTASLAENKDALVSVLLFEIAQQIFIKARKLAESFSDEKYSLIATDVVLSKML